MALSVEPAAPPIDVLPLDDEGSRLRMGQSRVTSSRADGQAMVESRRDVLSPHDRSRERETHEKRRYDREHVVQMDEELRRRREAADDQAASHMDCCFMESFETLAPWLSLPDDNEEESEEIYETRGPVGTNQIRWRPRPHLHHRPHRTMEPRSRNLLDERVCENDYECTDGSRFDSIRSATEWTGHRSPSSTLLFPLEPSVVDSVGRSLVPPKWREGWSSTH